MYKSLREYFAAHGRHDESPVTVGDLIALEEFGRSEAERREAEAVSALEAAPEPTAAELAGTSAPQLATDAQRAEAIAQADGATGLRHFQEDTERPPLALV